MTDTGYRRRGGYDYDIAMEIGLNASIVLDKIAYFLSEKQKQKKHLYNGNYWFYTTYEELADKIGVLSVKQVRKAILDLKANDYIIVDHFSFGKVNRTTWYTIPVNKMQEIFPDYDYNVPPAVNAQRAEQKCQKGNDDCQKGRTINNELPEQHTELRENLFYSKKDEREKIECDKTDVAPTPKRRYPTEAEWRATHPEKSLGYYDKDMPGTSIPF